MGDNYTSVDVAFHGVRGSTPCSCPTVQRYGGNTSCVTIESEGQDPIILDLGTGLRPWGCSMEAGLPITFHALVTHMHWDHVQGLPFFTPLQCAGTALNIHGPGDGERTMASTFERFMSPPYFPIRSCDLPATVRFHDTHHDEFDIGETRVMSRPVPHTGKTNGYRITRNGVSVAYVPDHQEPIGRPTDVDEAVLELCDGVDLLIHDAQLWQDELAAKATWGHCTPEYAVEVAAQAGVRTLALFHHDPSHTDEDLDEMTERIGELAAARGVQTVVCATEGLKLSVAARA
ncbi:MAG: MBL fold metallo-hydrolase [Acidimicrobiales bacterium]|nr:MBL fold metallo-hydrolase [Acidimicrobiales bacterium]